MPCACKSPPVNVPDNIEWGPVFWKLLHGLAWKAGRAPLPGLQGDEIRAWRGLLSNLAKTLPCEHCRQHLQSYILANPIEISNNYSELREYVSRWLHRLHEDVNSRLGKPSFLYEEIDSTYNDVNLRNTYEILQVLIKRSVQGSAVSLLSWTNWTKHLKTLFGFYN